MKIIKEFKVYYGHRNETLDDKCFRPHGHDAKIFISFNVHRRNTEAVTTLFKDYDVIEEKLKNEYDHRFFIHEKDLLYQTFKSHQEITGEDLGFKVIPFATSVENMCFYLWHDIETSYNNKFDISEIRYQETRTSTVIYTKEDYFSDLERFSKNKLI